MSLRFRTLPVIAAWFLIAAAPPADPPPSGTVFHGRGGYTEYIVGDLPLILAAPHGGTIEPPGMTDRVSATGSRYDTNSLELARSIREAFLSRFGSAPHLILTYVHRKKLDANREAFEAAQGDSLGTLIWDDFHGFIDQAKERVAAEYGAGLFIDLHGHRHPRQRVELGYLLTGDALGKPDDSLDLPRCVQTSSLRALAGTSTRRFSALVRGPESLGALYESRGYSTIPSPAMPGPDGELYFSGGYNTERHGSRDGGFISGIQIETPSSGVRDTEANRRRFAAHTADILMHYLKLHFRYRES